VAELSVHAFTVYDVITRGAAVHRDAPAVIQGDRTLSFGDFHRRVDELAAGLAGLGIGRGERICVLAQNDAAYLDLYGACARQGIIAYPINWWLVANHLKHGMMTVRSASADAGTHEYTGQAAMSGMAHAGPMSHMSMDAGQAPSPPVPVMALLSFLALAAGVAIGLLPGM